MTRAPGIGDKRQETRDRRKEKRERRQEEREKRKETRGRIAFCLFSLSSFLLSPVCCYSLGPSRDGPCGDGTWKTEAAAVTVTVFVATALFFALSYALAITA